MFLHCPESCCIDWDPQKADTEKSGRKLADTVQDRRGGSRIGQSPRSCCRPDLMKRKEEAGMDKESSRSPCRPG